MPYARVKNELPIIPGYAAGDIVTIEAASAPLNKCVVNILPVQSGTGDPSPSNVRPITGHTELNLVHTGANLWDEDWEKGDIGWSDGQATLTDPNKIRSKNFIPIIGGLSYYLKLPTGACNVFYYDENETHILSAYASGSMTITPPSNACYMKFAPRAAITTYNHDISINYPSTDTSYHAYTGTTTTTDLGTMVYGGTLDVVSGVLTVTKGYIDSYDGETLPSDWICDRAVYASGTTPPTGSQVVYTLATPTTIQLTPQEVKTILGQNNIFADSGDIDIIYIRRSRT